MHPMLNAEHQHEACAEVMRALKNCHDEHSITKYLGACNDQKHALNMCFRKERLQKARENSLQAKARKEQVEAKWKEIEAEN